MALDRKPSPNDLNAFWMPFTSNRQFKKSPRMFVAAKDMHYTTSDGRQVLVIGSNADVARFSGLNVARVKMTLFLMSGFIAVSCW